MKILIACEYSGRVRDAFIAKGHDAISCDILPSESDIGPHIQGDVMDVLSTMKYRFGGFDMIIAHPPCTRLCNSGVCWLAKRNLWDEMRQGAAFFKAILDSDCDKIAIENPIPHKYAVAEIGRKYDQIIQPWMFGHGETKATCLWLKGLPKLKPTDIVDGREQRLHKLPPSKNRAKLRSLTYQGIADAMAEQWG